MNDQSNFSDRLELFFGEAADALAHVYARLRGTKPQSGLRLTGTLKGPSCHYGKTLKATFSFVDRGAGDSLLAEAIVPEPCFWTPDMPQLYQVDVQLRRGAEVLARAERIFGIRRLAARGRNLFYDARRWVLRGMCRDALPAMDLARWREADLAMVVHNPDDQLCHEASRTGVLLVAQLKSSEVNELHRLSRWPAVAMIAVPSHSTIDQDNLAPNLLLAEQFAVGEPLVPAPWAQLVFCDVHFFSSGARLSSNLAEWRQVAPNELSPCQERVAQVVSCPVPVVATHIGPKELSTIAGGRSLCDRLQSNLAGRIAGYDFAGYLVLIEDVNS